LFFLLRFARVFSWSGEFLFHQTRSFPVPGFPPPCFVFLPTRFPPLSRPVIATAFKSSVVLVGERTLPGPKRVRLSSTFLHMLVRSVPRDHNFPPFPPCFCTAFFCIWHNRDLRRTLSPPPPLVRKIFRRSPSRYWDRCRPGMPFFV